MKKLLIIFLLSAFILPACNTQSRFETGNPACDYSTEDLKNYPIHTTMQLSPKKGDTIATLKTNHGDIHMLLYDDLAPETTKNFIELAAQGKYSDTVFHRVIDCFMLQGGDFENNNGTGGYSYKGPGTYLKDEFGQGLKHLRGAVSMANAGPNTAGSQFFIVQADYGTSWLDGRHAVFGFVYDGMDVVDEIAKVKTLTGDRPVEKVTIESVTISTY